MYTAEESQQELHVSEPECASLSLKRNSSPQLPSLKPTPVTNFYCKQSSTPVLCRKGSVQVKSTPMKGPLLTKTPTTADKNSKKPLATVSRAKVFKAHGLLCMCVQIG